MFCRLYMIATIAWAASLSSDASANRKPSSRKPNIQLTRGEMYASPRLVKAEREKRSHLKREVRNTWKRLDLDTSVLDRLEGRAVLFRQLATFRREDEAFINLSKSLALVPAWLTYALDRHTVRSPLKRSYMHPRVIDGVSKDGALIVSKKRLVDMHAVNGERLADISMESTRLVDWHNERLVSRVPDALVQDISDVFLSIKEKDRRYEVLFSIFVAHAVLFENYHGGESGGELSTFSESTAFPAFRKMVREYGVPPLIVSMPWKDSYRLYPGPSS